MFFFIPITLIFGCSIGDYFMQKYYKDNYKPVELQKCNMIEYPDKYTISGVPCISYENAYCASAAMQMVLAQKNIKISIDSINWLMGFTYSFYYGGNINYVLPYSDPEMGYVNASFFSDIKRKYLVTSDSIIFVSNIKSQLSLNIPIRVALNSATLYNKKGFNPHSILLIGYTKDSVCYYETGGKNRYLLNHHGEKVDWNRFLQSVKNNSNSFRYPWLYNMMVFEIDGQGKSDKSKEIWINIGNLLIGRTYGPTGTGAKGMKQLIEYITKNELSVKNWDRLISALRLGIYTRSDNSNFIKRNFKEDKFQRVSNLLNKSSELYKDAIIAAERKDKNDFIKKLNEISEIENNAGELLIKTSP